MTLQEAMAEIESHELAARLNVASDSRTFFQLAQGQKAVLDLEQKLDSYEVKVRILSRAWKLSRYKVDLRYENQWDTALAVYVWLISRKDFALARIAADAVIEAPQCWWAAKISRHIILGKLLHSDADVQKHEHNFEKFLVNEKTDSGETQLSVSFLSDTNNLASYEFRIPPPGLSWQTSVTSVQRRLPGVSPYEVVSGNPESEVTKQAA